MKWTTDSFGHQLLVELFAGLSFAFGIMILQFGLLVALLRFRLYDAECRHQPLGQFRADHLVGRGDFRRRAGRGEADRLQLFGQQQQRRSDHLRCRARDDAGQPDPGPHPALVGAALPAQPFHPSRRPSRESSATCAKPLRSTNCSTTCSRRIEEGVRSVRSAFIVERLDPRNPRRDDRRGRGVARPPSTKATRATCANPRTACSRSASRSSRVPKSMRSRSATSWSGRGPTARFPAARSRRLSRSVGDDRPRHPHRHQARSSASARSPNHRSAANARGSTRLRRLLGGPARQPAATAQRLNCADQSA